MNSQSLFTALVFKYRQDFYSVVEWKRILFSVSIIDIKFTYQSTMNDLNHLFILIYTDIKLRHMMVFFCYDIKYVPILSGVLICEYITITYCSNPVIRPTEKNYLQNMKFLSIWIVTIAKWTLKTTGLLQRILWIEAY